jgi:surfeit locus 1 family protein
MRRWVLIALAALGTAGLIGLGVWQVERRAWKLALIERVEQRVHAAPVSAPGPERWASLTRENVEYLKVAATGHFEGRETLVQAVTALGAGFWVMAPFRADDGFTVLINRGFVPAQRRDGTPPAGEAAKAGAPPDIGKASRSAASTGAQPEPVVAGDPTTITGLLRITEPSGGFLRANAPAENRWYSRDVAAISHAQNLSVTAPYFIDADASTDAGAPVGGLTVVTFRNSHLLYAITWFTLALMVAALGVRMARHR